MIRLRRSIPFCRAMSIIAAAILLSDAAMGGEVRLRNGMVLKGNLFLMAGLREQATGIGRSLGDKDVMPKPQLIIQVDNGWQKYYVPRRQIPDEDANKDIIPTRPESFVYKLEKAGQSKVIASVGSIVDIGPFNEFGQRKIALASSKGTIDVVQAISRIEPDHVVLDALNYKWQMGVSLKAVPPDVLKNLLHQKVKSNDAVARFALVRFYSQAEMYQEAFDELEKIAKDFPDLKGRADIVRTELSDYFGREILRELNRRKAACQHMLAIQFANALSTKDLSGSVMDDVRKFLRDYEEMGKSIVKAKNQLAELQVKLDPDLIKDLQPLREEINEQLNVETLARLDAFLQSETDSQLTSEQRLALAYSGWVVGASNAITDLKLAIRYWDARFAMLEAVRADNIQDRDQRYQELRRVEGVGPRIVLQLTALLPPILDGNGIRPGVVHRVQLTPDGQQPAIAYSVLLPPEYSPFHSYPLLIALRSRDFTTTEALNWWGGDADNNGPAMKRGYIVIAPEYVEDRQPEYTYSTVAHQIVLESLRDARKRFNVDSDRVFLAGHGMGADAAFDLGMSHPDEFAGVIPIGGECENFPARTFMNGRHTAWYAIGRGYQPESRETATPTVQRDRSTTDTFDSMFKYGFQFDFMLVEYLGRGVDRYMDEVPRLFEWMDLHRRKAAPREIEVETLRKTDNRFFWVTAVDLPWSAVLPAPAGPARKNMTIIARITEGNKVTEQNSIRLESPAKRYFVRLSPDTIDFDKRVEVVRVGGKRERLFYGFVTPEATAILDELRLTGDRTRLPLATLEL